MIKLIFLLIIIPFNSYAYLDPFTGSILAQIIVAVIAFISVFFKKIKLLFIKIIMSLKSKNNKFDKK